MKRPDKISIIIWISTIASWIILSIFLSNMPESTLTETQLKNLGELTLYEIFMPILYGLSILLLVILTFLLTGLSIFLIKLELGN